MNKEHFLNIFNSWSFLLFVLFQIADYGLTHYGLSLGMKEGNPFIFLWMTITNSPMYWGLIKVKIIGVVLMWALYVLLFSKRQFSYFITFVNGIYFEVIRVNIINIWF